MNITVQLMSESSARNARTAFVDVDEVRTSSDGVEGMAPRA
jgi:hypothetical protein